MSLLYGFTVQLLYDFTKLLDFHPETSSKNRLFQSLSHRIFPKFFKTFLKILLIYASKTLVKIIILHAIVAFP